jgi:FAD binding domain
VAEPRLRELDALRRHLTGAVVAPGDSGWDLARRAWNLAADQHPAAVVIADGAQDVTATLAFATRTGLHVAPQATGHGAPSLPGLDDAILLRTRGMTGVAVDGPRRRARAGAGALWSDVVGPAADEGLVGLHGFSGGVGVAGYTLGGGLGWLGRSHGLACNAVTALEVVLADGRPLRVDAETEPDLFWALRGGGGAAAIVTTLELELFPLREAFAGQLAWPLAQAADVVEAYRSWTSGLPDELTSAIRLMRYPPLPELPPELRGRAFVIVTLVFGGDAAAGEELVAALRGVGSPAADTLATIPARDLPDVAGDPPGPLAGIGDSALLRALDVDAFLEIGGPEAQTALTSVEVRHLGGALGRSAPEHGAADAIDAPFLFDAVGTPVDAASADGLRDELDRAKELLAASATGRTLLTFAEREPRLDDCLPGQTAARVREITRRFDRGGIIRANHAVGA